jgi:dTDP-D-glucose 4,6-dehydratase
MKTLVTGGAGFIGSEFVRMVVTRTTHRVVNLDELTYAGISKTGPRSKRATVTGLSAHTIAWYQAHTEWVARVRSGAYRDCYERIDGNRVART